MIRRLLEILLILLLIVAPFGLILRFKILNNVYVLPQDIIVFLIFICIWSYYLFKKETPRSSILLSIFAFLAFGLVSVLINSTRIPGYNFFVAFLYPVRYFMYLSLLFLPNLVRSSYKRWVYFSGSVVVLFGFIQHIFYKDLGNLSYLGWDNHLYRLFSTFLDPNFAGAFFVIFLFYSLPFLFSMSKYNVKLIYLVVVSLSAFISIFLTYSRTSLVMLVVAITFFLLSLKRVKLLLISFMAILVFVSMVSDVRIEGLNPFRTASTNERIKSATQALDIASKNPLFGIGFNGYRYAQVYYGYRTEEGATISNADAGTDNSYLFVFATTGVIGLGLFIGFLYFVLREIDTKKIEGKLAISLFISVLAGSLFLNLLFYTPLLMWVYLIIGGNLKKIKADR